MKGIAKKADNVSPSPPIASADPNLSNKPIKSPNKMKKSNTKDCISYKIRLLDIEQNNLDISIGKNDNGEKLFAIVCEELGGIVEDGYFGLRYTDKNKQRQWLELGKSVKKQLSDAHSSTLSFRVKHYPGDPFNDFQQKISLYLLYLQLRRDLVQGRLICPLDELYTLGALIVQAELGDATNEDLNDLSTQLPNDLSQLNKNSIKCPQSANIAESTNLASPVIAANEQNVDNYLKDFKIVVKQNKQIESEIIKVHKTLQGLTVTDAENAVIQRASKLPTYGVDPFEVKVINKSKTKKRRFSISPDGAENTEVISTKTAPVGENETTFLEHDSEPSKDPTNDLKGTIYLGLRHDCLTTFASLKPCNSYYWNQIHKLFCDGKDFIVVLKPALPEEGQKSKKKPKPETVIFRCQSKAAALAIWKWTSDRKDFFTLKAARDAKKIHTSANFFRRRHSYRFMGKSHLELKSITSSPENVPQPSFIRVSSLRRTGKHSVDDGEFGNSKYSTFPSRLRPTGPVGKASCIPNAGDGPSVLAPVNEPSVGKDVNQPMMWAQEKPEVVRSNEVDISTGEQETPIKPLNVIQTEIEPPVAPINNCLENSNVKSDDTQILRHRETSIDTKRTPDPESIQAVNAIDEAIEAHKPECHHTDNKANTNGEVSTSFNVCTGVKMQIVAVLFGTICLGILIAALEMHPSASDNSNWSSVVRRLHDQPLIASFNNYIYTPTRGFFINGFASFFGH